MSLWKKISNYWWCQLLGWGLVGLSFLFAYFFFKKPVSPAEFATKTIIVMAAGIVSTHLLRICIKRNRWLLLPIEKVMVRMVVAVIATCIIYSALVVGFNEMAGVDENRRNLNYLSRLLANVLNGGIFVIPWALFYYFYHYLAKSRKQEFDTLKLEALVKELELKTIKAHINPHFIFNALNSIRALIDEDPARARNAVTHLSNILRSSMQAEKLETVPFEKELNIVKDYLALEHIRFEERLHVDYSISNDTLNSPVPPMMLQTLVENAIKHGIGKRLNGGLVRVSSSFHNGHHVLEVQNTGKLNGQTENDGFGLFSARNRLYLMFGEKANFEIAQRDEDLVVARVSIPKT